MTLQTFQRSLVYAYAMCIGALVITGLLSIWEIIGEKYYDKSMWSIVVISIGVIAVLIVAKITEMKEWGNLQVMKR